MTSLLFYKNVVAVNSELHKALRLSPASDMKFSSEATAVPIVVGEFVDIARQCPIVFVRADDDGLVPVALMGLPNGKNLYLDESDKWNAPYIPAFVRRYPFIFAETGPNELTLCMDRDFAGFNETEGELLFDEDGKPGKLVKSALELLGEYQRQHVQTEHFTQRLESAGILMEATANASLVDGRSFTLQGMLIIDENKFRAIPQTTLVEWFGSGELGLIYAHLMSLGNLLELLRRQPDPTVKPKLKKR